ncbi:MAG: L,D-transpeptidase, partial [Enterococcus sp.]|nr:L,D-transpeptidase [Enterococcus sp.]
KKNSSKDKGSSKKKGTSAKVESAAESESSAKKESSKDLGSSAEKFKKKAKHGAPNFKEKAVSKSKELIEKLEPEDTLKTREKHFSPKEQTKRRIIAASIAVGILAAIYFLTTLVFCFTFYPNTYIGDYSLSAKSLDDANLLVEDVIDNYSLNVSNSNGYSLSISKNDIFMNIDKDRVESYMKQTQNPFAWPIEIFMMHDLSPLVEQAYDQTRLKEIIGESIESYNKDQIGPTNATAVYNAEANTFVVQEEKPGTKLDLIPSLNDITKAVTQLRSKLVLNDNDLLHPTLLKEDSRWNLGIQKAMNMIPVSITIQKDGATIAQPDKSTVGSWITFDDDVSPMINTITLGNYCDDLAKHNTSVGEEISYIRPDGKAVTVAGGSWKISIDTNKLQNDISQLVLNSKSGTVTTQNSTKANTTGSGPVFGNRYVDVDITEQHARFYDNGKIIWESDIVSGDPTDGNATRQGVWTVLLKQSPATLKGYKPDGSIDYVSEVSYWMLFDSIGIGFHDATWQSSFGGQRYKNGAGSHGCINLPLNAARTLYSLLGYNEIVVVHN